MLNELQKKPVVSRSKYKCISAGAGTGKTHTLVEVVLESLRQIEDPSCIVAVTFTRNAALELRERLMEKSDGDTNSMFIGTFHSFCLSVIMDYIEYTGYNENINIFDRDDRKDVITNIIDMMKLKNKVKYSDIEEYAKTNTMNSLYEQFVYDEYLEVMKIYNAIDLTMIIPMVNKLLLNDDLLADLREKHKYFFVDEFQDTNDEQLDLINRINPESLVIIGDPDQAIYEWNGARPENMVNIKDVYEDMELFILEENYRSTKPIVKVANDLIKYNKNRISKKLVTKKEGINVVYKACETDEEEISFIANNILAGELKDNAVICRSNKQASKIHAGLIRYNIKSNLITSYGDPFKSDAGKLLTRILRLVNNHKDDYSAQYVATSLLDLSVKYVRSVALMSEKGYFLSTLAFATKKGEELYNFITNIGVEGIKELAYERVVEVIAKSGILGYYGSTGRQSKLIDIDEYRREVRKWQSKQAFFGGDKSFEAFMRHIEFRDLQDKLDRTKDCVNVMTVHGSKGLEFPNVFVSGCNEGHMPSLRGTNPNVPEERRIMYVAITRAQDRLFLTRSKLTVSYGNRLLANVTSRFIYEMGIHE